MSTTRNFTWAVVTLAAIGATLPAAARPPNVILILIDDMGLTDLGCYGSTFYETPHIDKLAAGGMRLTNGYSACTVCSPTRAAVLTGKYPARLHITDWIAGHDRPFAKLKPPDWTQHLPLEEATIAEVFKSAGYATAHIGKWHLGNEEFWPTKQGFDINIGGNHRGQPPSYFFPYERQDIKLPGLNIGMRTEYLTDRLTEEAKQFITVNKNKPFFLYLPHYTVHTPLQAKEDLITKYQAKSQPDAPQKNATYAAMIESLDDGIGQIMTRLETLKLVENTIIIFTSDNGGLLSSTTNLGLRAGKGSAYEGGVRVPLIVSYPPAIKTSSVSDLPAMSIDLLPTLVDLAGLPEEESWPKWDGISLAPVLTQSADVKREALYWHYPHYHPGGATPYSAVRAGDWRLVEFHEDGKTELFNLKDDPTETTDLAASRSDKRDELLTMLRDWRKQVGAQMPVSNPNHDPARAIQGAGAGQKGKGKASKAKQYLLRRLFGVIVSMVVIVRMLLDRRTERRAVDLQVERGRDALVVGLQHLNHAQQVFIDNLELSRLLVVGARIDSQQLIKRRLVVADLDLDRDFLGANRHFLLRRGIEDVERDLAFLVVRPFGVILLLADHHDVPAVRTVMGMVVPFVAMSLMAGLGMGVPFMPVAIGGRSAAARAAGGRRRRAARQPQRHAARQCQHR